MEKMAYSMLPEEISITITEDYYEADNPESLLGFLSLSSLQDIADIMGDGQTAESVSSGENVIKFRNGAGSVLSLASGKSIPMLRNVTLYPNLGICFNSGKNIYESILTAFAEVINIETGELLSTQELGLPNDEIRFYDIYSFNSTTKAIEASSERGVELSAIIFTAKGIITAELLKQDGSETYRIILPDGTYSDTRIYNSLLSNSARSHFEPVFGEAFPAETFEGIYIEIRSSTFVHRVVNYGDITYTIFGNNARDINNRKPQFVVSGEILEQ